MSIDLGHEFFKVGLMRQGKNIEIVLNTHSKRKTTTAVSFFESVRVFGDDALAHQGKAPAKVPMFFHSTVGKNYTAEDVTAGGKWWKDFGLGDMFYAFDLVYDAERGSPVYRFGDNRTMVGEELLAHVFSFCKTIAEASGEGDVFTVKDVVIIVPSDATLRQRQAIVAAAEIAGLRVLTLVHENSAFAVQRATDYSPELGSSELALFYNLGARKAEATVLRFESRSAGMVKGKTAPVVSILGSATDTRVGGHFMDLKIAEVMLKRFQEKHPKLADGIATNARALRKLLGQAQKTKATLSANKMAPFITESLYQDTDFQATISRQDFEDMCADLFAVLTDPIEKALAEANATMKDIQHVEVIGGAWRVPKVQELLSDYIEKAKGEKIPLGQHLNGEEAGAFGAVLVAANASTSFRVRKIFFSDVSHHEYALQAVALNGEWEKNVTTLYPLGSPLGGKKKLSLNSTEDFAVRVFEDGVLLTEYTVTGVKDLLEGKWKDYNLTGTPKISATVPLEMSGIIELKTPTITVEEAYWVNVTKKTNATGNSTANGTGNASTNASEDGSSESSDESSENASDASQEPEVTLKLKKKKHEKKLTVKRKDFMPLPLSDKEVSELKAKLADVTAEEAQVQALAGLKNELEAAIYGSRDKIERDEIVKVSTEEQREEVTKMATDLEEWMYEAGHKKADYEEKLGGIRALVAPMEERAHEFELRSGFEETVAESIADMKKTKAHIEANMSWINASKTEAAEKKLGDFEDWWAKKQESQAALPLHEAPAYTVSDVNERLSKLQKDWDKMKKTKKPKEAAPKAEKGDADSKSKKKKGKDAKAAAAEEPLPEDLATAKKELEAVREKKAAAVEKEDFDLAHSLKQREDALAKQVERIEAAKSEL